MGVKTFIIEWDTEDLKSMAEVLLYGVPNLRNQVTAQMKDLLDREEE